MSMFPADFVHWSDDRRTRFCGNAPAPMEQMDNRRGFRHEAQPEIVLALNRPVSNWPLFQLDVGTS
jgi:hypothetical protein